MDVGDKVRVLGYHGRYEIMAHTTDGRPIVDRIEHGVPLHVPLLVAEHQLMKETS